MSSEIRVCWWHTWGNETTDLDVQAYPDGMPLVPHGKYVSSRAPIRLLVRPSSVTSLMTALWFVDALVEHGYKAPELILPHVPGGRQDRLNPEGDYLFTLKSVAREINLRRFPRVVVLDPHSDVTPALIDRCEVQHIPELMTGRVETGGYGAIVSPDAGAEKRAGRVAKWLGKPLIRAWKTRDVKTGAITGFGIENLFEAGLSAVGRVLVVDDICDAGGTFVGLGELLAKAGVRADLWTTHGFYTKGTQRLLAAGYDQLLTTDSILRDPTLHIGAMGQETIHSLDVCDRLLKGIL